MRTEADQPAYIFAGYRLDPVRGTLFDLAGAEMRLRPKPFVLLRYLLDHPGRLLGRDELLAALWPGVVVTDDSLTQCVSELRRAFGDRAADVLRTVPRRGYLLTATVERDAAAAPDVAVVDVPVANRPAQPLGLQRRATLLVVSPTSPPGDTQAARLAPALASDLIAELVRFEDLRVVAASDTIASGVFALFTELHAVDDTVRAFARLEDTATGTTFWADRVEWQAGDRAAPLTAIAALAGSIDLQIGRKSLRRA